MTAMSNLSLFSLFLFPLFVGLSSSPSSSSPSPSLSPSPSISIAATNLLRAKGYSLFANILDRATASMHPEKWSAMGTLFAPTDPSLSPRIFKNGARGPPLLSHSFLLYHNTPQRLLFQDLALKPEGTGFPTFYGWRCIFLSRSPSSDLFLAPTKKPISGYVRIRDPNLFCNGTLIIHGVDGILDHSAATSCRTWTDYAADDEYPRITFVTDFFFSHALQALGENGYSVAATALGIRRSELIPLPGITVFAPSDEDVFSNFDGFSYYDLRRHVLPSRLLFIDLAGLSNGTILATMAPGQVAIVKTSNAAVMVNGVPIGWPDIYHNEWIVVHPIPRLLPIYLARDTFLPDDQNPAGFRGGSGPLSPTAKTSDRFAGGPPNPSTGIEKETKSSAPSPRLLSDSGVPAPSPVALVRSSPSSKTRDPSMTISAPALAPVFTPSAAHLTEEDTRQRSFGPPRPGR